MIRFNYSAYIFLLLLCCNLGQGIQCCQKAGPLFINGTDIFHEARGSQLLLAFVEGTNKHSKKQVRGLDLLLHNFLNMDVNDIIFVGINKKEDKNIGFLERRATYKIYQEPPTSDIWKQFGIKTNDFLVFDRCGFLVGCLSYPGNLLLEAKGRVCTDRIIRSTYQKSPCEEYWHCRSNEERINKSPFQVTEEQQEDREITLSELPIQHNRKGTQADLMTRLKHLLLKDEKPDAIKK